MAKLLSQRTIDSGCNKFKEFSGCNAICHALDTKVQWASLAVNAVTGVGPGLNRWRLSNPGAVKTLCLVPRDSTTSK